MGALVLRTGNYMMFWAPSRAFYVGATSCSEWLYCVGLDLPCMAIFRWIRSVH